MNPASFRTRILAGHLLALCAGIGLAWGITRMPGFGMGPAYQDGAALSGIGPFTDSQPGGARPSHHTQTKPFQEAWDLLLTRSMPGKQDVMVKFLRDWAEVDLAAALAAAEGEDGNNGLFAGAFAGKIARNPGQFLPFILNERQSISSDHHLEKLWVQTITRNDPMRILTDPELFSDFSRPEIILASLREAKISDEKQALHDQIMALPDSPENRQVWISLEDPRGANPHPPTPQEAVAMINGAGSIGEELGLLNRLAESLRDGGGNVSLSREDFDRVPPDVRTDAALVILTHVGDLSSAHAAIDYLVEQGEWAALAGTNIPWGSAHNGTPEQQAEVLDWVTTLPARDETAAIYEAVLTYNFEGTQDRLGDWLETLRPGWQRDHALVAYADSMAKVAGDRGEKGINWAAAQVTDERLDKRIADALDRWKIERNTPESESEGGG